ncbi:hypothetical protein M413DRAFT_323989 [Hebeloma cylindrosporum]|uniref:Uncharacterized protein n=1 Tax=Hebeloma cylindrosporum TaxID=76867 RepID=A0A0C2Y462_HEBCY|nr:hypothetical protein M413DRAFT_323989 [Hebeloma cylindrosporum h7]
MSFQTTEPPISVNVAFGRYSVFIGSQMRLSLIGDERRTHDSKHGSTNRMPLPHGKNFYP